MTTTDLARPQHQSSAEALERVLVAGDLSRLSATERLTYYREVCESVGLNPLTRPFDYLILNDRMVLYAKKDATDQLRAKHRVSVQIVQRQFREGLYIVTARASTPDGRYDEDDGVVSVRNRNGPLTGDFLANAMLRATTKAKRRVTLAICGLGWLDEAELDSIPEAQRQRMVVAETGEIVGSADGTDDPVAEADAAALAEPPRPPQTLEEHYVALCGLAFQRGIAYAPLPPTATTGEILALGADLKARLQEAAAAPQQ